MIPAPNKEFLIVGDFPIYWYGVIVSLAVIICYLLIPKILPSGDKNNKLIDKFQQWYGLIIVAGFVGARVFEALFYSPEYFLSHPWQIFNTRLGGLSIFGGIIGASTVLYLLRDKFKGKWLVIVELTAILAPLGQAIGRWGNFFNQELYGWPCQQWWCLNITAENRLPGWENFSSFQPTFLYESLLLFGLFAFLWYRKNDVGCGYLLPSYLVGYGLIRFVVEFFRIDVQSFGWFKWPQLVAIIFVLIGVFLYLRLRKNTTPQT